MKAAAHHTPEQLLARLDALGIETETTVHVALFTVEESKANRGDGETGHCKNLFLKDKKGNLWLIVCDEDRAVDLKALRHKTGAGHLSFGKAELLYEILGVTPGAVTPLAAINDADGQVNVIIDATLMDHAVLHFHPLDNTMTTRIAPRDLVRFLGAVHREPRVCELDA